MCILRPWTITRHGAWRGGWASLSTTPGFHAVTIIPPLSGAVRIVSIKLAIQSTLPATTAPYSTPTVENLRH